MAVSKRNLLFQGVIFQVSCIEKVAGIGLLEAWSQRNFLSSSNGPQMVLSSRAIVELGQVQHINLYQLPTNCRHPNPENPDIQHYPIGTNISPFKGMFEDHFPFLQVGYVSSLEGFIYTNDQQISTTG